MKIIKFRRGHATNSSSSHSIILAGTFSGSSPYGNEYGWDWFTIEDEIGKLEYMGTQLKNLVGLREPYDENTDWSVREAKQAKLDEDAAAKIKELLGVDISPGGYVDHQSVMGCPTTWDGSEPNIEFFAEFSKALAKDPTVAIRGGNDNEDRCHCGSENDYIHGGLSCTCEGKPHPSLEHKTKGFRGYGSMLSIMTRARKSNGVWVLYSPHDGSKLHLDLRPEDLSMPADSYRPEFPELVDLKINDYCDIGCKFCYQDSTEQGGTAPTHRILTWMQTCQEQGVLEVAIGGGEPTLHPEFGVILEEASKRFLNVAFTTKDTRWLSNEKLVQTICGLEQVRSIGWSVNSASEMTRVKEAFRNAFGEMKTEKDYQDKEYTRWHATSGAPKLVFHLIPDATPPKSAVAVLKAMERDDTVLMLGLKQVGRGEGFKSTGGAKAVLDHAFREMPSEQRGSGDYQWTYTPPAFEGSISIDTAFAQQYKAELDKHNVSQTLYYLEEGRFSLYYDAVANQYGPSSYEPTKMRPALMSRSSSFPMPVKEMFSTVGTLKV
jgi:organic radical activating enzyme